MSLLTMSLLTSRPQITDRALASRADHARATALELLQDFALPEACNIETWFDRIETRGGQAGSQVRT